MGTTTESREVWRFGKLTVQRRDTEGMTRFAVCNDDERWPEADGGGLKSIVSVEAEHFRPDGFGGPRQPTVSWPSIGSVDVDLARAFAEALRQATIVCLHESAKANLARGGS